MERNEKRELPLPGEELGRGGESAAPPRVGPPSEREALCRSALTALEPAARLHGHGKERERRQTPEPW